MRDHHEVLDLGQLVLLGFQKPLYLLDGIIGALLYALLKIPGFILSQTVILQLRDGFHAVSPHIPTGILNLCPTRPKVDWQVPDSPSKIVQNSSTLHLVLL